MKLNVRVLSRCSDRKGNGLIVRALIRHMQCQEVGDQKQTERGDDS